MAIGLPLLFIDVLVSAVYGLISQARPEVSPLGIGIAAATGLSIPRLAAIKARLALNAVFGWWWVEHVATLLFLVWLARETRRHSRTCSQNRGSGRI